MRILLGNDILKISRVRNTLLKYKGAFLLKIFTDDEIFGMAKQMNVNELCEVKSDTAELCHILSSQRYLRRCAEKAAGRFSAKEAVFKALGNGFWNNGISMKDIEIFCDNHGKPYVRIQRESAAFRLASALGIHSDDLSISHDGEYVFAVYAAISEKP